LPNVRIMPSAPLIDDVLSQTRVLMMPSLWYEGFGLIVMESMLRGIPVVSSDSGGLVEAKCGTGYVIPVKTIQRYHAVFDEHAMPRPIVEANDSGPWIAALRRLLEDRAEYDREASASRSAGERFLRNLDAAEMERFLLALPPVHTSGAPSATIESLSPEKRALLLERLRKRRN
jgi:glycosyltransferase involved in cell wall biosynthesis